MSTVGDPPYESPIEYLKRVGVYANYGGNEIFLKILRDVESAFEKAGDWDKFYDHFKFFPLELMQWDEGNPDWEKFFKQCVINIDVIKQYEKYVEELEKRVGIMTQPQRIHTEDSCPYKPENKKLHELKEKLGDK